MKENAIKLARGERRVVVQQVKITAAQPSTVFGCVTEKKYTSAFGAWSRGALQDQAVT